MPLESATYIDDLDATNPVAGDGLSQADDHLRLIKAVIKATFPNIDAPVTATPTELNQLHTGTRTLGLANGAAATPSLYFDSDTDTGLYRVAADTLGFAVAGAGEWQLTSTALSPVTSDGSALGTTSLMISDVFLASGAVINFNAGNLTLTHSAGLLTLAGALAMSGDFAIATNKFTVASASGNTTVAGTLAVTGAATAASATVTGALSGATAAGNMLATQAELETGSATDKLVTPGRQHFHPSAAKAWVHFNNAGTIQASYNISSVVRNSPGNYTINIATDFSSAAYCAVGSVNHSTLTAHFQFLTQAAGSIIMNCYRVDTLAALDVEAGYVAFFGDQA